MVTFVNVLFLQVCYLEYHSFKNKSRVFSHLFQWKKHLSREIYDKKINLSYFTFKNDNFITKYRNLCTFLFMELNTITQKHIENI